MFPGINKLQAEQVMLGMSDPDKPKNTRVLAATVLFAWGMVLALSLSFWPGIMVWDSGHQYSQVLSGQFDDWHPPLLAWIWRLFLPLMPGPGPMLVLQLGLYGAALGYLACRSWQQGRTREAAWLAATGLFPPTLLVIATILKDSLMAAMLLAAFALLVRFRDTGSRLAQVVGVILILIASCLRFNAFLAGLPLLVMATPTRWIVTRGRAVLFLAAATAILLLVMPVTNALLHAKRSGVELSLVIFDLGGITAHGGGDAFPPMAVANPIAVNRSCYLAERWDSYSWWVDPVCPIRFATVGPAFARQHINPMIFWAEAILAHPIAYFAHRLEHWNIASQFLVRQTTMRWISSASDPNEWGFQVTPNAANRFVSAAVRAVNATPFGWPCWWLALSMGLVILARRLARAGLVLALAGSALLYELGYGVFSVAAELRYHCWPMLSTLIASVMFVGLWRRTPAPQRPGRVYQFLAVVPLIFVTLLGLGWRWLA